ncbi:hypothetical protein K6119_00870 [Paracrocinitomix mangrovi]|uniref:hypothetical protein n=1 Tax=Paracrocinitomix mangrovi TaxID=2862509 RepID=UPI001C8E12C9|nr:hypothetical protein [Paracrocinitomix mangrovi]UKN02066.1 hypothetical protein K6119_00870 [Paracrocinitomix mangrovi]
MRVFISSILDVLVISCGSDNTDSSEVENDVVLNDTIEESMDTLVIDQAEKDVINEVYEMSEEETRDFLKDYPDVITNRRDMCDILVKMKLATYDMLDPGFTLHKLQHNEETDEFTYNKCWDDEGESRFRVASEDVSNGVSEGDHPVLSHSYKDYRFWKIEKFEKVENGLRFWFEGADEIDPYRALVYTSGGFWAYYENDEGLESYTVSDLVAFNLVQEDC